MLDRPGGNIPSPTSDVDQGGSAALQSGRAIFAPIAANIAFVMELTLVPLLLPAIQMQFDLPVAGLAWVFNSYAIAVAVGVFLGGWLGDAFKTRRVFGFGVAIFAAGSLLSATAGSFETLIAGRALQGLGGGVFSPLVPILLTRASPLKPGRVLIVWGSIAGYIAAFAPLLYGTVLGGSEWSFLFIITAIIAGLALLMLRNPGLTAHGTPEISAKSNYLALFQSPNLWMTFVYVFCTYGSITYYLFRMPIWLANSEVTAASIGFVLSILWLTFSGMSTLLRNLVDRSHVRTIMLAAPMLIAAGFSLSFFLQNPLFLLISAVLVGAGLACSNAPSTQLILRFAPKHLQAASTSLDIAFARLGGIATVAALASQEFAAATPVIYVSCLVAILCASKVSNGFAKGG